MMPALHGASASALTLLIKRPKKPTTQQRYERRLYLAGMRTFSAGRKAVDEAALLRGLGHTQEAAIEAMEPAVIAVYEASYAEYKPLNRQIYGLAGHSTYGPAPATFRTLKDKEKKDVRVIRTIRESFSMLDPEALAWVEEHALELAKNLSATSRADIKAAVMSAFLKGDPIAAQAQIYAAVGSSARAEVIARTEIMTASNEGRRAGWKQAADDDLISKTARRVWIASNSACKICWPLNETSAPLNGVYENGSKGPPLHPNCRCSEGLV